jgi:hypothetical protein
VSDRLERALQVLRDGETGETSDAEATLQRVLASRRAAAPPTVRRLRLWLPIAAVLAVSTGALAHWGLPRIVRPQASSMGPVTPRIPPIAPPEAETHAPDAPDPAPPAPHTPPPAPLLSAPTSRPAHSPSAPNAIAPIPSTTPAATPAPDDADVYARAHRLHFDGGSSDASLAAWDDYLARFPTGRFVPEARFNRAIDLLRLHRFAAAREALQPFAEGTFGAYHRDEAKELLQSVP